MSDCVVLHDLGSAEAGEPWRAAAPAPWHVPDLPGHGSEPAPRHGGYDPMGPATLARWCLDEGGLVVGVGQNAHGALVLAAGGGCGAIAIVDGLWGTWLEPDAAIAAQYASLRSIFDDPGAIGSPPAVGLDPRATHGYGVAVSATFAQRFWGSVTCPVLAIETPASMTPPEERSERVAWFGGPTSLVELGSSEPPAVVAAVEAWSRT